MRQEQLNDERIGEIYKFLLKMVNDFEIMIFGKEEPKQLEGVDHLDGDPF